MCVLGSCVYLVISAWPRSHGLDKQDGMAAASASDFAALDLRSPLLTQAVVLLAVVASDRPTVTSQPFGARCRAPSDPAIL